MYENNQAFLAWKEGKYNTAASRFKNFLTNKIIMKTKTLNNLAKNISLGLVAITLIFSFQSCSTKVAFQNSTVVPGADGFVKVKKDNNSNYSIKIELSNLADPDRLEPAKKSYVVWMETDGEVTKNIGRINSSTSLLSKRMTANFETVSTIKPTKIFITAEDDASIQYPGTQVILSTNNF